MVVLPFTVLTVFTVKMVLSFTGTHLEPSLMELPLVPTVVLAT